MHRGADGLVAAEREGHVAHAAADVRVRAAPTNEPGRLDERAPVVVVLFYTRRDRQDVGVEQNVLGRKPEPLGQQPVGPLADRDLALQGVRLSLLVEGHDDDRRSVAPDLARMLEEGLLALLETDRVHDGFALGALEPGLDHRPF